MMIRNSDIEKKIDELKENIFNNKKSKLDKCIINKKRIWTQKIASGYNNIIININRYIKNIKQSKILLDEFGKKKKKKENNKREEIKMNNKELKLEEEIKRKTRREKFSRNIKSMTNRLKNIKNEANEIIIKDGKSLKNISFDFCRTAKLPKSMMIINNKEEKRMRPTSASTFYDSKMFEFNTNKTTRNRKGSIKQWNFKSFREGSKIKSLKSKNNIIKDLKYFNINKMIKEKEKKVNVERLNDMYRFKINRGLKIYTPAMHLKEMKQIEIEDVNIKRNINNINEKKRKRINDRCVGLYFKNRYEKLISKKKTNLKESKSIESLKNINNKNILSLKRKSYSIKGLFNRLSLKKEEQISDREKIKQKKESLKNILELLKYSLEIEPINEYINEQSNFKRKHKRNLKEDEERYFSNFEEINKNYKNIIEDKLNNSDREKNLTNIMVTKEILAKDLIHNLSCQIYE